MTLQMQAGDKGAVVRITVVDSAGVVVDVTGAAVTFEFESPDDGSVVSVAGVVSDGPAGEVVYVLSPADGVAETAGAWRFQVALVLPGGFDGHTALGAIEVLHNLT